MSPEVARRPQPDTTHRQSPHGGRNHKARGTEHSPRHVVSFRPGTFAVRWLADLQSNDRLAWKAVAPSSLFQAACVEEVCGTWND